MGARWIYPWCRTTNKYSCPAADFTGNRRVRSADDHSLLWRVKAWLEGRVSAGAVGSARGSNIVPRQEDGGALRVDATPLRRVSR
jgi:hypothetical protein